MTCALALQMEGRIAARTVAVLLLQLAAVLPQVVRGAVPPPVRYEVPMPFTSNDTVMEGRRTTTVASDEWSGPLSTPVAGNAELPHNKFSTRPAIELESIVFGTDATKLQRKSKCPIDLELVWAHPLEQGVYATPIVHQLLSGGGSGSSAHVPGGGASKQLIVPTFHQHMVMLDGDGHAIPEFAFSAADGSYFHTSPVMLDFDGDGVLDIVWTSVNAEVFVISGDPAAGGRLLTKPFFLPKLRIRKRWHEGVDAVPYTEFQHTAAHAAAADPSHPNNLPHIKASATPMPDTHVDAVLVDSHEDLPGGGGSKIDAPAHHVPDTHSNLLPAHLLKAQPDMPQHMAEPKAPVPLPPGGAAAAGAGARHLLSLQQGDGGAGDGGDDGLAQVGDGLTEEGRESLKLFSEDGVPEGTHRGDAHGDEHDGDGEIDAHAFVDPFDHRVYPLEPDFVWVDAHVLATPAVADVDRDGFPDVVFSVSYFFDEEDFTNHPHLFTHLGTDVNIHKYVAGGIVAWNLRKRNVIWSEHLDLTTDETELRAYIYSSPTVVDLDGDGGLEIIVGTSLGFIYAMHADNGHLLTGFPLSMSEIQAQVAVEDVNGDGHLELIALDNKGNVLCFDRTGKEIWERRTSGFTAQGATFGDVNGDMILDVVVGTVTGHVWALSGTDGSVLPHFPVKTEGRIIAPITLVNLDRPQPGVIAKKGLHLVFPSFDGHVYIVDGRTGCTNKVDIGEHAYGMVLVDDVLGNGHLDLLVSTMNGNVFLFGTTAPYHPLNTWTAQTQHLNGFTARHNYHGIYVDLHSREHRDILGRDVVVDFTIVDARPQRGADYPPRRYDVNMTVGSELLLSKSYTAPGQYREVLRALSVPAYATVQVHMTNEHAQYFYDSFSLGFNVTFYRTLKWLLALPFAAMAAVLVYVKSLKQTALPT